MHQKGDLCSLWQLSQTVLESCERAWTLGEPATGTTTSAIVMAELNCARISEIAWPRLISGIDANITVSDYEWHRASRKLQTLSVAAGPRLVASLATLHALNASDQA
jgi:hypothetical protein